MGNVRKDIEQLQIIHCVKSSKSDTIIAGSDDNVNYGVIVHGNIRAIASDLSNYGGLIGDNFASKSMHDNVGQQAFTAEEFLDILNLDVDSINKHLAKR
jgi:hypothetical protein